MTIWRVPPAAPDVLLVRDRDGDLWIRAANDGWHQVPETGTTSWDQLVGNFGPVTDVVRDREP